MIQPTPNLFVENKPYARQSQLDKDIYSRIVDRNIVRLLRTLENAFEVHHNLFLFSLAAFSFIGDGELPRHKNNLVGDQTVDCWAEHVCVAFEL